MSKTESKELNKKKKHKIKKARRPLTKTAKAALSILIIIAIIGASIGGLVFAADSDRSYKLYTKIVIFLMPDYIDDASNGNIRFFVKENPNYNGEDNAANPLNGFIFYYKDENGKEVDLQDGAYVGVNGEPTFVNIGFMVLANQKLDKLKNIGKTALVVFAVIEIGLGIVIWYQSWSRREDEMREQIYGSGKKKTSDEKQKK